MILDYQSFGCFYCDKKFATQNQVENHEKIHTGEKSMALDSSKLLENDLETFKLPKHHGNQFIQAFQPSVKNEGYDDTKEVTNETVTLDLKTFKLTKNHGNQFIPAFQPSVKNGGSYNEKEVTNGTISLECKYCGKSFSERMALKVHEKIHTVKNLSYSCNFCEKKFGSSHQAKNHEKVHTG